jgi:uncharacterized protein YoxC
MSFFKKMSETVKDTASTIGSKSMDIVETGKLKIQKGQLESNIQQKKTELGHLIYTAQKQNSEPDAYSIGRLFTEIKDLEGQIEEIYEKLHKEAERATSENNSDAFTATVVCPKCGEKIPAGVKFCSNCGEPQ